MVKILMICLGGALGTGARYGLNVLVGEQGGKWLTLPAHFPIGTLLVNITGCFAAGFLASATDPSLGRAWLKPEWRDVLLIGFCGGYTTFSTFGLQTLQLANNRDWLLAGMNVFASNALGLVAVYLGFVSAKLLQSKIGG